MRRIKAFILILFLLITCRSKAQESNEEFHPSLEPYLRGQLWNVYSDATHTDEGETAPRAATYFRRVRAGMKGKLLPNLTCDFELMGDFLAKPEHLSTKGTAPDNVKIWHMYLTWKLDSRNEWFYLTGGYFLPHVSREAATSLWTYSSLDKSETSCYIRQFISGKSNGIAPGFNLGGTGKIGSPTLLYNIALINRQDETDIQTTEWSPVLMGHAVLNFGDAEFKGYKYTLSNNVLRKQTSASFGFGFSKQGETDVFKSSSTWSADLMLYLGAIKVNGEYDRMIRKNVSTYMASSMLVQLSSNFFLKNHWVLEPAVMFEMFSGDDNYQDGFFYDGKDKRLDLGLNLIIPHKKMKFNLHYVRLDGEGEKNRYIKGENYPGNYAVLGFQFMI